MDCINLIAINALTLTALINNKSRVCEREVLSLVMKLILVFVLQLQTKQ